MGRGEEVYAYIDETGDRGPDPRSSPIFGMGAVLVDRTGAVELRRAVKQLRTDFGVPDDRPMSWKKDLKNHDRRRRAVEVLRQLTSIRVCYVYVVKAELQEDSYRTDPARFYSYVAYKTYKSVIWAARNTWGSNARLWTRFGHVRNHDHESTKAYIEAEASWDRKVPHQMEQGIRWVSADQYLESQAADIYTGFLKSALWPDGEFNYTEPRYLLDIWHQIRNSETCAIPLGIMSMPDSHLVRQNTWFPCAHCQK